MSERALERERQPADNDSMTYPPSSPLPQDEPPDAGGADHVFMAYAQGRVFGHRNPPSY